MFINNLVLKLQNVYDIYNYANDNTGGVSGKSAEEVCLKLKNVAPDMLPWFTKKFMEANQSKFKFIVVNTTSHLYDIKMNECVTLKSVKCRPPTCNFAQMLLDSKIEMND